MMKCLPPREVSHQCNTSFGCVRRWKTLGAIRAMAFDGTNRSIIGQFSWTQVIPLAIRSASVQAMRPSS